MNNNYETNTNKNYGGANASPKGDGVVIRRNPKYGETRTSQNGGEYTNNLLAFATVYYKEMRISGVQILVSKKGSTYLRFPGEWRKDKNGQAAIGEDGYRIYDEYVCPCSKKAREEINALVDEGLSKELEKDPNFFFDQNTL